MGRGLFWGGLAVGLGLGAGLGYTLGSRGRVTPPGPVGDEPGLPAIPPPAPQSPPSIPTEAHIEAPPRPAAAPVRPHPRVDLSAAQVADLKAKVTDLMMQLAKVREQLASQATPLSPPPDLPGRFSQPAVIAAITSALKEVGSHAQLTSVDCTEYPCIAYFQGLTDAELMALKQSTAYQSYAHDRFMTIGRAGPDGPYDGLIVWPMNDPNPRDNVRSRLRYRMGQMLPPE